MGNIKFEIGKTYKSTNGLDYMTVSKRTEKTIWFCDNCFFARIKVIDGVEQITPAIGIVSNTYKANTKTI